MLDAATSSAVRREDDKVTYINKGKARTDVCKFVSEIKLFRTILRSDPGVHSRPGAVSQVRHSQVCHHAGVQVKIACLNMLSLIREREKVMKDDL